MKNGFLCIVLLVLVGWTVPAPASAQSDSAGGNGAAGAAESAEAEGAVGGDSELVESFVADFNAGEIDALAFDYADRLDRRLFAWSADLGQLETVSGEEAEGYIAEHIAAIGNTEQRAAFERGWAKAASGAGEQELQWVLVSAEGLARLPGIGVPALVFGVVETGEGERFAVGTIFDELIEELVFVGESVGAVAEEGIGVDPAAAR